MGLDCYVIEMPKGELPMDTSKNLESFPELHYWRKNWALQDWMSALLHKKRSENPRLDLLYPENTDFKGFNGIYVQLKMKDIEDLTLDLLHGHLDWARSISFNEKDYMEDMLQFISEAYMALKRGKDIWYAGDY